MVDTDIVNRVKQGDEKALKIAVNNFDNYSKNGIRITVGYIKKWSRILKEDYDDLYSISLFEFYRCLMNYDESRQVPIEILIFKRLNNLMIRMFRKRNALKRQVEIVDVNCDIIGYVPKRAVYREKLIKNLKKGKYDKSSRMLKLVELLLQGFLETKVIAQIMGVSNMTVRNLFKKLN